MDAVARADGRLYAGPETGVWRRVDEAMSEKAFVFIIDEMGKKLAEFMTRAEYEEFCAEVARKAFLHDVEDMEDGDFKEFILANINEVLK